MPELLTPDLCVIGGGPGGVAVAAWAGMAEVPVVLVEKGRMGGSRLHHAGVPAKALIAAANRAEAVRHARAFGIEAPRPAVDFARVRRHVQNVVAALGPNDSAERVGGFGVRVVAGTAWFKDASTVAVGDDIEIRARRFVIAAGSSPAIPDIPGLSDAPYFTSDTIFELAELPEHLLVIGGGPTGLELAQAFRRLGAAVTVIEAAQPLAGEDRECAAIVVEQLEAEGIVVRAGTRAIRIEPSGRIRVLVAGASGEETIEGSHLLVAAGRTPNVAELGLDAAGIVAGPRGIVVDQGLRTRNRKVYAIGDVVGGPHYSHVAEYHAGLVLRSALFRQKVRVDGHPIPRVVHTAPELAQVGLTEEEARGRRRKIAIQRWPASENDRARTEHDIRGHIKVITTPRGRILGATIVGAQAGELIAVWTLALAQRLDIRAMAGLVVPHPTRAEAGRRAALMAAIPGLTSPFVQRIMALLRRLG